MLQTHRFVMKVLDESYDIIVDSGHQLVTGLASNMHYGEHHFVIRLWDRTAPSIL